VTSPSQRTAPLPGAPYQPAAQPPAPEGYRAAVAASFLGWTLDAFDYWLVAYTLTAIAKDFGQPDKAIAFANGVTLWCRPIGALIFGLMADRFGRKRTLMANLLFFSVFGVATGFAKSYAVFLVLRGLFGVGMGGEWGVGSSLAMEKAPKEKRGIISGLLQEGYATGNLLAAVVYFLVFDRWGWRAMFFIGGVPALLAIYVRTFVKESEVWERTRHREWGTYVRALASHWRIFAYIFVLMTFMNFISHGTQDMYPTFLKRDWHFTTERVATISIIANIGAIGGGIIFGHFSDRLGRRKAIVAALIMAIFVVPLWALSSTIGLLVAGGFLMQFMVQGAWGVIPAHINELAPDSVRGFLPGFAYQCGVAAAGLVGYIEAVFAEHMSYAHAMSFTALTVFALGAVVAWFGREKHKVAFG
jgi:SHS family lactate transporter-like MFS transporter